MSIVPRPARGLLPEPSHPGVLDRSRATAVARHRWEVRAAQWRARELAEEVFGPGVVAAMAGVRPGGFPAGMITLDVPFRSLETHRSGEARFLSSAWRDPVLSRVPILFILGPRED